MYRDTGVKEAIKKFGGRERDYKDPKPVALHVPGLVEDFELECVCYNCTGLVGSTCPSCGGTGLLLNQDGKDLINFIRRHKKLIEE